MKLISGRKIARSVDALQVRHITRGDFPGRSRWKSLFMIVRLFTLGWTKKNGGEYLRVEYAIRKYIMEVFLNCNT